MSQPSVSARRKQPATPATTLDRLPPHSTEAERGIIGCFLLDPVCVDDCDLKSDAFYDLRHRKLYEVLKRLWSKYKAFDLITVHSYLKKKGWMDEVGGIPYLSECMDYVPSAANLPNYIGICREKYELRKIITTCSDVVGRIYDYEGNLDELKFIVQSELSEVLGDDGKPVDGDSSTWTDLLEFETDNDRNTVIGMKDSRTTRWLCRGQSAWLIGPSGVGKSSLMLQMGVAWAANRPAFGITPARALRVLVVQAENDKGDMAEMAKGIETGLGLAFNEMVQRNIRVRSVTGKIGQTFCAWLRKEIEAHRADLVLVDPLLSFAGIDVSRQDQASQFCRIWLDPVLRDTGAVLISVHHTGKPPRKDGKEAPQTLNEMAYQGIGSSELVNWARAVMFLQPAGEGQFRFMMAKRGKRAGATHPNGEPTQVIWLRHATDGSIFWEQIDPPAEVERHDVSSNVGRPSKVKELISAGLGGLIDTLTEPVSQNELCRKIERYASEKHRLLCKRNVCLKVVEELFKNKAINQTENGYVKAS